MTILRSVFSPRWAGGWFACRWIFVFSQMWSHLGRFARIPDAYACPDMVFGSGPYRLTTLVIWRPETAMGIWVVALFGLLAAVWGGRWTRPGLCAYLLSAWCLLAEEALNVKAHDRLALWVGLALLISPANERGLADKSRSPVARYFLMIVFGWLYFSTGTLKALHEPGWFDGSALQYHLVHEFHAGGPLALWLSAHQALCQPIGWFTVAFEISFPFLMLFRRANPWALLCGVSFHLGILTMMNVGAFSFVALSAYPVLLTPEVGDGWWRRFGRAGPTA